MHTPKNIRTKKKYMRSAIRMAQKGMDLNEGGPFGAVIVRENEIIAKAYNRVIKTNDPTAHAEILAIRKASKKLGRFDLSDCEIYSTCEPCPMCLGAIIWAKIPSLYYGCTKEDADRIEFSDKMIYESFTGPPESKILKSIQIEQDACLHLFEAWVKKEDKVRY